MNDQTYFSELFLIGIQENDYIFPTWTGLCFSSPSFEYEFIVIHFGFGHGVPYNSLSVFFFHAAVVVAVLLRDQLWLHWYS